MSRTFAIELRNTQIITDQTVTFANSDAANTQKTVTITKNQVSNANEYELIVYNPSTVTDLTVKVFNTENSIASSDRDAYLTSFSIPKSQAITGTTINTSIRIMHGLFNGVTSAKFVFSNDTVLGVSDGFSAVLRLRELI